MMQKMTSKSIVVKSRFHNKKLAGTKGAPKGKTPGSFVRNYMARDMASEPLPPVKVHDLDAYDHRFQVRGEVVDRALAREETRVSRVQVGMRQGHRLGGVAFDSTTISMSHDQLVARSEQLQELYDRGHTVMTAVIAFDRDYIKDRGLVPQTHDSAGNESYRSQLDQMKLRRAVQHGMRQMGTTYDNLQWAGIIQVDTDNVHCHIAMADAGRGRLAEDGTQVGKVGARKKKLVARGIDSYLQQQQHMVHMPSSGGPERSNVVSYVRRWAHESMLAQSDAQFMVACLPADTQLWHAVSTEPVMAKPNRVLRQIVEEAVDRPDSGLDRVLDPVRRYAQQRGEQSGLSQDEQDRMVDNARTRVVTESMESVYSVLREAPELKKIRTPVLDVMSVDLSVLQERSHEQGEDDSSFAMLGYRLRSYGSRMDHHKKKKIEYRKKVQAWDTDLVRGRVHPDSEVLRRHWEVERQWHERLQAKYRALVPEFNETQWRQPLREVMSQGEHLERLDQMRADTGLWSISDPKQLDEIARSEYGIKHASVGRQVLDVRAQRMRLEYDQMAEQVNDQMFDAMADTMLVKEPSGRWSVRRQEVPRYSFDAVRGLDLHHMQADFGRAVSLPDSVRDSFIDWSHRRHAALEPALTYLHATGQSASIATLPVRDVSAMVALTNRFYGGQRSLESVVEKAREVHGHDPATVRIDAGLGTMIREQVTEQVKRTTIDPRELEPSI